MPSTLQNVGIGLAAAIAALAIRNTLVERAAVQAYPPPGTFISVEGELIHYQDKGEGQPIVLLPGSSGSSMDFEAFFADLAAHYRVITLDRPGQAWSPRLTGKNYRVTGYADLLHAFLREIGVTEPVILLGHSYGGAWASAYALRYPEAVAGILYSGAVAFERGALGQRSVSRMWMMKLPFLSKQIGGLVAPLLVRTFLRWEMRQAPHRPYDPMPETYTFRVPNIWARPAHMWTVWDEVNTMDQDAGRMEIRYKQITAPVIVLTGDKDSSVACELSVDLHREIAGSRLVILKNVGHHPNYVRPGVVAALLEHLAATARGAAGLHDAIPVLEEHPDWLSDACN